MSVLEILFLSIPAALIIVKVVLLVFAATWALRGAVERGGLFSVGGQGASLSPGASTGHASWLRQW